MGGTSFCPECGAPTTSMTEVCAKCGARVAGKTAAGTGGSWMPMAAGILDLVIGIPDLVAGIILAVIGGVLTFFIAGLGALLGAPFIILSIVAIVGGVFAIRKRVWGLALAAAICGFVVGLPFIAPAILLGIPAIVFTVLGKRQFK
ncbi:MAG TPA: hypothetical protein VEG43_04265, partial [Dehalococcoidia bacterium]|nr:hypothetical protein [Dehalococcoidia bacterium]